MDAKWTSLSLKKAQRLKIPAAEGRWYIVAERPTHQRQQARDHGHAIELQGKKDLNPTPLLTAIKITPGNPNRLRLERAFDDFDPAQELLRRAGETVAATGLSRRRS